MTGIASTLLKADSEAWEVLAHTPRSEQTVMGVTDATGCLRRWGYKRDGVEPSNDVPAAREAALGTLIHAVYVPVLGDVLEAAGHVVQVEVAVNALGVLGHADLIVDGVVVDLKTRTTYSQEDEGYWPEQLAGYGAEGEAHIIVLDRDNGSVRIVSYDAEALREATERFKARVAVSVLALDDLDPDPERGHCSSCPWEKRCWGADIRKRAIRLTDETLTEVVDAFVAARAEADTAKVQVDAARALLFARWEALREPLAGTEKLITFTRSSRPGTKSVVDVAALEQHFKITSADGARVPKVTVPTPAVPARVQVNPRPPVKAARAA